VKFVQKLLIKSCCERDYSAQEVGNFLLASPYYVCSRAFVKINFNVSEKESLVALGTGNGSTIFEKYAARKPMLESMSLLDMARGYFFNMWTETVTCRDRACVS